MRLPVDERLAVFQDVPQYLRHKHKKRYKRSSYQGLYTYSGILAEVLALVLGARTVYVSSRNPLA